jgi:hypothetical protein
LRACLSAVQVATGKAAFDLGPAPAYQQEKAMQYKSLDAIRDQANVIPFAPSSREYLRALRRERLERFAAVLERHSGPVTLLSGIEYIPERERMMLRLETSPLSIAYADPELRRQGLAGDRLGDAMAFFQLTRSEAHHLLCDCHYVGMRTSPQMIAARARAIARRMTVGEAWAKFRSVLKFW